MRTSLRHTAAANSQPSWSPSPARQLSDEELLARMRDGDNKALEIILGRYWGLVVGYIERLTASTDAAEDIAQRAFCQLWDRRRLWGNTGSLRALLCRIARNFAVSEHRRALADDRSALAFAELAGPLASVTDTLERQQLSSALDRAIARLPERRREILVLRCVHELSYKEIADVMSIAQQTVANQMTKALATLRDSLAGVLD